MVAYALHCAFRDAGHESRMVVGRKTSKDPDVREVFELVKKGRWARMVRKVARIVHSRSHRIRGAGFLANVIKFYGTDVMRVRHLICGNELVSFPECREILNDNLGIPDVVICHNLHGRYFDLRVLPQIARQASLVFVLHDAWLLSGHCAHSLNCEKWKIGCGACPRLDLSPRLWRDGTAGNWAGKREIFRGLKAHIITPSEWLMQKAKASILQDSIISSRVIRNGINTAIMKRGGKLEARKSIGLPPERVIVLAAASNIKRNSYKDFETLRRAIRLVGLRGATSVLFVLVGDNGDDENVGNSSIMWAGRISDYKLMAQYYQACDIYVHCAVADTFPTTILEAMACGAPVIASEVGGIPEQLTGNSGAVRDASKRPDIEAGILIKPSDAVSLADAIELLATRRDLAARFGENGLRRVGSQFDMKMQVASYIDYLQGLTNSRAKLRNVDLTGANS